MFFLDSTLTNLVSANLSKQITIYDCKRTIFAKVESEISTILWFHRVNWRPGESSPTNLEEETLVTSADENSLANDQFQACASKIADLASRDLGATALMQLAADSRSQISSVSFGVSCPENFAIDASKATESEHNHSHAFGRLPTNPIVTSPNQKRKRSESNIERYQADNAMGK